MIKKVKDIASFHPNNFNLKDNWDYVQYLDTSNLTENKIYDLQILKDTQNLPSRAKRKVQIGDILFSSVRPNQKHYGYVDDFYENLLVSTGFIVLSPDESINGRYLYYWLTQDKIVSALQTIAENSTSSYPSITKDDIMELEIDLPSREEQDKITSIISNIEFQFNNGEKMLNEIVNVIQKTFSRWFNQFEFPNENGKPYKSSGGKMYYNEELKREIPVGWSAASLNSLVTLNRGISYSSEDLLGNGIPMVNLASFNTDSTFKYEGLKTFSGQASENKYVNNYDLLMCVTQQTAIDLVGDTDVIAKTFILPPIFDGSVVSSMDVVNIVCNHKPLKYYIDQLFKIKDIHKYATGFANGTKIKHLDVVGVLDLKVPIPDDMTIIDKFAEITENMVTMSGRILKENIELKKLKDYLLPMLMNGQLQII